MSSTPSPEESMEIFFYAAPIILGISLILCGIRVCLVYLIHIRTERRNPRTSGQRSSSIEDIEQPSTIAFSRSPFFEMFRQYPPPPTYEDTIKQARANPTAGEISGTRVNQGNHVVNPPPLEANPPPPYGPESERNSMSNNSIIR